MGVSVFYGGFVRWVVFFLGGVGKRESFGKNTYQICVALKLQCSIYIIILIIILSFLHEKILFYQTLQLGRLNFLYADDIFEMTDITNFNEVSSQSVFSPQRIPQFVVHQFLVVQCSLFVQLQY